MHLVNAKLITNKDLNKKRTEKGRISESITNHIFIEKADDDHFICLAMLAIHHEVGAGFIYDDAGHIVTANHVLAGVNNVSVVFKDGDRYDADVVGRDAFTDTAVLKIVDNNNNTAAPESVRSSQPVTLGNSIGYPFVSKITMTARIIGHTDYLLYFPFLGYSVPNTIETDVAEITENITIPLLELGLFGLG